MDFSFDPTHNIAYIQYHDTHEIEAIRVIDDLVVDLITVTTVPQASAECVPRHADAPRRAECVPRHAELDSLPSHRASAPNALRHAELDSASRIVREMDPESSSG